MASTPPRRGHAAIGAILKDMGPYLPPDTIDRPGYKHCRTTYGLLTTTYQRAVDSPTPDKVYTELQHLEHDLRRRLANLSAAKGVPAQMTSYLDELRDALQCAVEQGVDAAFVMQGLVDMLADESEAVPAPRPERVRMVPDTQLKQVRAELAEARRKIRELNEENNKLVLCVRKLEARRGE